MGKKHSKDSNKDFKKEPWRKTKGWGKSVRDELKAEVVALHPAQSILQVPSFNILLVGQITSGKSSFINSINCIRKDDIYCAKAGVGEKGTSLTTEFHRYWMSPALPLSVYDTKGIDPETPYDVYVDNILEAVEGHVPDGYVFTRGEKFHRYIKGYIENPTLAAKAHCVAIVVNAAKVSVMQETMVEKLKSLANGLFEKKIPFFVLLTHMDEFCKEVHQDTTKMFRSTAVENLVIKTSKMVHGLPENHIFPVINYSRQVQLDDNVDILILYALRQMFRACCDYLENLSENQKNNEPAMFHKLGASFTKFGLQEEEGKVAAKGKIPTESSAEEKEEEGEEQMPEFLKKRKEILKKSKFD